MQESVETFGKLVVSGRKAAELLEAVEESLDEIARLVAVPINLARRVPIAARGMMASAPVTTMVATNSSLS